MLQYIFLSHDVDWPRQGAPLQHILSRKDRFEPKIIEEAELKNPYYNIPDYMDIEDKFGIRSTFFFRTFYDGGNYLDYEDDIRCLIQGGWEIGLHCDPSSVDNEEKLKQEKIKLQRLTKSEIKGNRSHYLAFNKQLPHKLKRLGFVYDSSLKSSKEKIQESEMGYRVFGDIVEFPVTLMDAYIFTYMHVQEDSLIDLFKYTLNYSRHFNKNNIITVIWHDNVLKMKGGRLYKDIIEYLVSQQDTVIIKGIDLAEVIKNNRFDV